MNPIQHFHIENYGLIFSRFTTTKNALKLYLSQYSENATFMCLCFTQITFGSVGVIINTYEFHKHYSVSVLPLLYHVTSICSVIAHSTTVIQKYSHLFTIMLYVVL